MIDVADGICENPDCKREIKVTAFKGKNYCSENCRKVLAGELPPAEG